MISYKPLFKLLIDKDMSKKDLVEKAGISWSTIQKFNNNQTVTTEMIDRVCKALDCQPNDIMEIK